MKNPYILALPIALATIIAMMATDLYLPAVPELHLALGGTPVMAQYTLASFMAAFAVGQLVVGAVGDRYDKRIILIVSLLAVAVVSAAAALSPDMTTLIILRALQGLVAAACVALAPAMVRELGDEQVAIRMIGFISSIESIVPAAAPAVGVWLMSLVGWAGSFYAVAIAALATALVFVAMRPGSAAEITPPVAHPVIVYLTLLKARRFMAYTLSHALGIGALVTFIFAAPYVLTTLYGRDVSTFAWMQVFLVGFFVVAVNIGPWMVRKMGADQTIVWGSLVQVVGGLLTLAVVALVAAPSTALLTLAMCPVFVGLGLRSGPGFTRAMDVSGGPDGSSGALMVFVIAVVISLGTAVVAPFLTLGAWTVAAGVALQTLIGAGLLVFAVRPSAQSETAATSLPEAAAVDKTP